MAGLTGGLRDKVDLGDVLIADPAWDWGSGKYEVVEKERQFSPNPEQIRLNPDIRNLLSAAASDEIFLAHVRAEVKGQKPNNVLRAHVGGVASGASVLSDTKMISSIKEQYRKLLGVEMEIYGVMIASELCPNPRPVAFSAKAVSDFADETKDDGMRGYSAQISAQFIKQFAIKYLAA